MAETHMVAARRRRILHHRDPLVIINLARNHTTNAIKTLADLMMDPEQPGPVRVRSAEILIERGYGKAPVALHISSNDGNEVDGQPMSIEEKIRGIMAARGVGEIIDLEASALTDVVEPTEEELRERLVG